MKYGVDDYITKPFSSEYLLARIENMIERRKKLQEKYRETLTVPERKTVAGMIEPEAPLVVSQDEKFLELLMDIMEHNMDNSALTVEDLVSEAGIGRSVFFKKIKSLTGLAPVEFIREVRIKRAAQLIQTGEFTISQVTYMVGINDPRYFSRCFKQRFGIIPSEYRQKFSKAQQQDIK